MAQRFELKLQWQNCFTYWPHVTCMLQTYLLPIHWGQLLLFEQRHIILVLNVKLQVSEYARDIKFTLNMVFQTMLLKSVSIFDTKDRNCWGQHHAPYGTGSEWKRGTCGLPITGCIHKSKRGLRDIKIFCLSQQKPSHNFKRKRVDICLHQDPMSSLTASGEDSDSWMTSSGRGNIHISNRMLQEKQVDWKWMTGNKN